MGIGAGLAQGNLVGGILIAVVAAAFGVALSKWIAISVGSLLRKRRTRGETLLALIGVVAGLGGALFGQIAPVLFRHADSITALRWTPPGAIAYALTHGLRDGHAAGYTLALAVVTAYTFILIAVTYWLSRRAILGGGRRRRARATSIKPAIGKLYRLGNSTDVAGALRDCREGTALRDAQCAGADDDGHAAHPHRGEVCEQTAF